MWKLENVKMWKCGNGDGARVVLDAEGWTE